jgi:hypothetical protein
MCVFRTEYVNMHVSNHLIRLRPSRLVYKPEKRDINLTHMWTMLSVPDQLSEWTIKCCGCNYLNALSFVTQIDRSSKE